MTDKHSPERDAAGSIVPADGSTTDRTGDFDALHVPGGHPIRSAPPTTRPASPPKPGVLPDPAWTDGASVCVGCGYSLEGLAAPGVCPECGGPFDARQLVLAGVPNRMKAGSGWRRLAWGCLVVLLFLHSQTWVLSVRLGWWVPLAILGILVAGVAGLALTSSRERSGTEQFVVTPAGITRVARKLEAGAALVDSIFIPWGEADAVHLKRISPYWKRLRVGTVRGKTVKEVLFDAGIRCPDKDVDLVVGTIRAHLNSVRCKGCGNSLDGMDAPGACPKCGAPFDVSLPARPSSTP